MKKRFLPISLFLTIIVLVQTSFVVNANGDSGKYNPRGTSQATVESFMKSIRANQETGLIDPAWLVDNSSMSQSREESLNWTSLGPDNYGSLTRAIVYDKNDASCQTIYIGTMGGGILKSTNGGITWKSISDNMMVSSMVQTQKGDLYVGTGEGRSAQNQNGLNDLNYSTGFQGEGIYKSTDGNVFEKMNGTSEWTFVNDLAVYNNTVYAATSEGLFVTTDGENWNLVMEGVAYNVEVNTTGIVLALVDNNIYTYNPENQETSIITNNETNMLPANTSYKVIAASPSNPDYIYVAYIDKNKSDTTTYQTGRIYYTDNFTSETSEWKIAYEITNLYNLFGSNGLLDHALIVYPNNPKKILVGGADLWALEDNTNSGIYRVEKISSGNGFQISNSGGTYMYNYSYVHTGIQNIAFNPNNVNEFFIGSEGGIFQGKYNSNSGYTFEGKNRYFADSENHTSVARMFNVAHSGNTTVIGGSLDHGTIKVIGDPTLNDVCTGNAIFPNDQTNTDASATYGSFNYTMSGGPCAISTINPNAMFITVTGSHSIGTSIYRTQTAGNDYDKENFSYSATENAPYLYAQGTFRTPLALYENYNDNKAIDTVMFYNTDTITYKAGETLVAYSLNADYPFEFILTKDLAPGDSIEVQDVISSTFITSAKEKNTSKNINIYLTRDALKFSEQVEWWKIATLTSSPNVITISNNGDIAYVGTLDGKLYKYEGLTDATTMLATEGQEGTEDKWEYVFDSIPDTSVEWDTTFFYNKIIVDSIIGGDTIHTEIIVDTTFVLDTVWMETDVKLDSTFIPGEAPIASLITSSEIDATAFNGQAITSISIDPQNNNNVLVTLGNYGNNDYVFYSEDGGNTFKSIQGNLQKMPVYSSIIDKSGNGIIIGTEKGIYTTTDGSSWTFNGLYNIPVMDLKQQIVENHGDLYKYLEDEIGDTITTIYPGVFNEGVIYAATYGKGLYKCEDYMIIDNSDLDVEENISAKTLGLNIYPNPMTDNAYIKFDLDNTSDVTYQIYDLTGRMVSNVSLGKYSQGSHNVNFNVSNLNAGTYIIKVQAGETSKTSKILVY